ncbi:hypothetical protein C3L33_17172, partial [Rhododendron williamsianum]
MGDVEIDIKPYLECMKMELQNLPTGTVVDRVQPNSDNCLGDGVPHDTTAVNVEELGNEEPMGLRFTNRLDGSSHLNLDGSEWKDGKGCRDQVDGDVFHEIFRYRPHHISTMSPGNIQNVDLHEGDWGTVGSVIFWNYTHDGKEKTAKEVIEAIDEEKKLVTFKLNGDVEDPTTLMDFCIVVTKDIETHHLK